MRYLCFVALLSGCISAGNAEAQAQNVRKIERVDWAPTTPLSVQVADLPSMPEDAAGCLVIGYYVLADGTTAKSRVMQGAYTKATPEDVQKAFAEASLGASRSWVFRFEGNTRKPVPAFEWTVVGFKQGGGVTRPAAAMGLQTQDARVKNACDLGELAAWGAKRAVPLEQVVAQDKVLAPFDEPASAFWSIVGEATPPKYPADAFLRGIEGCVIVGTIIGSDGVPGQFRIMESRNSLGIDSSAKKLLEDTALYTVSRWRFGPGPDNPGRIPAFIQIPVAFVLVDSRSSSPSLKTDCEPKDPRTLRPNS